MRVTIVAGLAVLTATLALGGCAQPEREWMKVNQPYTAEEFRRDLAACRTSGTVDDACMKSRGWVSVSPPKSDKPPEPLRAPGGPRAR